MKYYAVTDDPNELMHFGIKGMKWGVIRSPEQLGHYKSTAKRVASKNAKPKSQAYISASSKLRKMMKSGIEKAKANWNEHNSPENQAIRAYNKQEKSFQKHLQKARQGRLKYKGISDEEIYRINDRLALENMARAKSGNEKQSFARRLVNSYKEGIIQGVGKGTSSYIDERMKGRGKTTAQIKGERRKIRAEFGISGRMHNAMDKVNADRKMKDTVNREIEKDFYKNSLEDDSIIRTAREANILAAGRALNRAKDTAMIYKTYGVRKKNMTPQQRYQRYAALKELNAKYSNVEPAIMPWSSTREKAKYLAKKTAALNGAVSNDSNAQSNSLSTKVVNQVASPANPFKPASYKIDRRRTINLVDLSDLPQKYYPDPKSSSGQTLAYVSPKMTFEGTSYRVGRMPKHRKTSRKRTR